MRREYIMNPCSGIILICQSCLMVISVSSYRIITQPPVVMITIKPS